MEHVLTGFADEARARKAEDAREMGIDDAIISTLVDQFYDRVHAHPSLGPIFARRVCEWPILFPVSTYGPDLRL